METKICTNIEQSKRLIELGIDEATTDFYWICGRLHTDGPRYQVLRQASEVSDKEAYWPAWSLPALLKLIGAYCMQTDTIGKHFIASEKGQYITDSYDEPIDACYEMIIKLHELKML